MEDAVANNHYTTLGLQLQNLIKQAATDDANKFFPTSAFLGNLQNDYTNNAPMGKTYPGLISLSTARANFLKTTSELNVVQPTISDIITPSLITKNMNIKISVKVTNANTCTLFTRFNKQDIFQKATMYDDGLHDDGVANDGIYATSIFTGRNTEMQYYIYAENNNIAVLSPARAEYEFHTLQINSSSIAVDEIYINECMSSNQTYTKDAQGDYDDWIELWNASSRDIELCGWYLTDDKSNLKKYLIPDTIIKANTYLVIWADEDGTDVGLHSNFKLSKSGETLYFNDGNIIIDSLKIPALGEDISYGRCGLALQEFSKPSIAAKNDCVTDQNTTTIEDIKIFPNPSVDEITITNIAAENIQINIIDNKGKIILTKSSDDKYSKINIQMLNSGIYFIQIMSKTKSQSFKLLKA
ncbi:MAG: lamin tail domain-containing protein [Saprospiraceae bacterium]|nr:lamin tail domain-containing protein [Saprospiraceae bacterium]